MHLFERWEKCITRCNMCLTGRPSGKKSEQRNEKKILGDVGLRISQNWWKALIFRFRKQSMFWSKESKSILQIHCSEITEYQRDSEKQPEMKDIFACKGITTRFREDFSIMPWKFRRCWNYILQDLRENNCQSRIL